MTPGQVRNQAQRMQPKQADARDPRPRGRWRRGHLCQPGTLTLGAPLTSTSSSGARLPRTPPRSHVFGVCRGAAPRPAPTAPCQASRPRRLVTA